MARIHRLIVAAAACGLLAAHAAAGPVSTRAELVALLADQLELEDFEGVSLHAGTYLTVPNPYSSTTAPAYNLVPGVTYFAPQSALRLYAGFWNGDDSVLLTSRTVLTITFDTPQRAVGLDSLFTAEVEFFSGGTSLGVVTIGSGSAFAGWSEPVAGITSIVLTATRPDFDEVRIDNLAFGAAACPGDLDRNGDVDLDDLAVLLGDFGCTAGCAGDVDGDGDSDLTDLSLLLANFGTTCP